MNIYEEEMTEAQKVFDEQYSKGEYCHEQSFLWGFQEGVDFEKKKLVEKTKELFEFTKKTATDKTVYIHCSLCSNKCFFKEDSEKCPDVKLFREKLMHW